MFFRLMRYDAKAGFRHTVRGWIFVFLLFLTLGLYFLAFLDRTEALLGKLPAPSMGDFYVYLFRGDTVPPPDERAGFYLPGTWLLLHVFFHYTTGFYVLRDLKEQGHQVLLRTRSTSRWWLSKCIWCFFQTIAYFGLLFLICAVFCFTAGGKLQLDPNPEVVASIIKGKLTFSPAAFRIHVLLMPFLVSVALCLLQQTVALFTGEGVSFVIICSWLFLSIYRPDALMIGNYTMLLRSLELYPAGVRFQTGIVLSLAVVVLSIVVGALKLKNMDVGRQ